MALTKTHQCSLFKCQETLQKLHADLFWRRALSLSGHRHFGGTLTAWEKTPLKNTPPEASSENYPGDFGAFWGKISLPKSLSVFIYFYLQKLENPVISTIYKSLHFVIVYFSTTMITRHYEKCAVVRLIV